MFLPRVSRSALSWLNGALGLAGVGVVVVSVAASGFTGVPAAQAASGEQSVEWGAQGEVGSDSSVTVSWDNEGNSPENTVYRDQRQLLPHTIDKTYFDVSASLRTKYKSIFGAGNGLGGLKVTVSQTRNLVNQSVTIEVAGAGEGAADRQGSYLQVFQCWGAMGADGKPDPAATAPDPASCQIGPGGADNTDPFTPYTRVLSDALLRGADWANYSAAPITAISGEIDESATGNVFFNKTTTNEMSRVRISSAGTATRQFEIQTGSEASHLGCGYRPDAPSTSTCWLVIVPHQKSDATTGALNPSLWAQRMQVQLEFQDIGQTCSSADSQLLIGGSELMSSAFASWIPEMCGSKQVAVGYSVLGDGVARNQYVTGSSDAVVTSEPLPAGTSATYVPIGLAAPSIGYTIDYRPACDSGSDLDLREVSSETEAEECGYDSLAQARADYARYGEIVDDLRLNARLVAKLLTQSYGGANIAGSAEWAKHDLPVGIFNDPEFRDLNPQLAHVRGDNNQTTQLDNAMAEAMRSDAADAIWQWILRDAGAASFLAGCPDPNGEFINPFYSTRTYEGCEFREAAYEKIAKKNRDSVDVPDNFADEPLSYPPDGSPYPLVSWYETPGSALQAPFTQVDHLPRVDNMQVAGRNAFKGISPRNSDWCPTFVDSTCLPAPGKWKDPKKPLDIGSRAVAAITDTPSAARYQLPTALLCDETGEYCAGANSASLAKAAGKFAKSEVSGLLEPAKVPDYKGGAYPLTLPVYAAINAEDLSTDDRAGFVTALRFMTTTGQKPGTEPGELPVGYAPLTKTLAKQAETAIAKLAKGENGPAADEPDESEPSSAPSDSDDEDEPAVLPPAVPDDSDVPSADPTPSATPTPTPAPVAATFTTPVKDTAPQLTLPIGLGIALLAGIIAPFLRKRTRVRAQR